MENVLEAKELNEEVFKNKFFHVVAIIFKIAVGFKTRNVVFVEL